MQFPPGKPILALALIAVVTGAITLLRPTPPRADLTLWTFAESHAPTYAALAPEFERQTGKRVAVDLIGQSAEQVRLQTLLMSDRRGSDLPDAVEIGIDAVGRFFRAPVGEVGFLPLNRYLQTTGYREIESLSAPGQSGWNARFAGDGRIYRFDGNRWTFNPAAVRPDAWIDRLISARLAPCSKDGVIFGIPHDVHPTTLVYRADLFEQAGIDLPEATRWDAFQSDCLKFQAYWAAHGHPERHAMELYESDARELVVLLLQRGINLVDDSGATHLADPRVASALEFYAQLVAGPRRIAWDPGSDAALPRELADGTRCVSITPDWRSYYLKHYDPGPDDPSLSGKLRMMPLPRFEPGDPPTSTWSGTMIAIPRNCADPAAAWKLVEYLYFSDAALEARVRDSGILPPLKDFWQRPIFHQPDPFYGGQRVWELYIRLAPAVPAVSSSPAASVANGTLSYVLGLTTQYIRSGQPIDKLDDFVRPLLARADADLRRRIVQMRYEP